MIERCWDGNGWFNGAFNQAGAQSSAISWQDGGGLHIRVYLSSGSYIQEWCCDPNYCWGTGSFSFTGVSSSAVVWTKPQLGLRVYVYNGSSITERCYDGNGWYGGAYS